MSFDLTLKSSCSGCGSTSDLYGSNCKHMTLCLTCGKTMAENRGKCYDCGATVNRLIRVQSLSLSLALIYLCLYVGVYNYVSVFCMNLYMYGFLIDYEHITKLSLICVVIGEKHVDNLHDPIVIRFCSLEQNSDASEELFGCECFDFIRN
jgi:hypothetical protein